MALEGPLLHSQAPAVCPYPGPDQSSHASPSRVMKTHFNIILPSTPRFSKCSLTTSLPTKTLYAPLLSPIRPTCSVSLFLLHFIKRKFGEEDRP